jgi:hypothetical protein
MVRRGRLTAAEAASSPQRHIILQAIGPESEGLNVDVASADLRAGDRLILASDGLFGMLQSDDVLRNILVENPDNDAACRALIDAANDAGGADNITVVIVEVIGDPSETGEVPVVVERDVAPVTVAAAPAAERRSWLARIPRLAIVAVAAALLLAVMAVLFFAGRAGASYVVSTRGGVVVVLDGRVGSTESGARGEVVERFTDERLDEFPNPTQRELRRGYEVTSLEEARQLVNGLPRRQGPKDTPSPEPSDSPSPDPDASPDATPAKTP